MVFDESGRVSLTGASHKVNLSAIKKGSYFISIFSKHKKATFSIQN
ncbi:MAG: hypothetical protein IPJ79_01410 [Bacteroidetes bacterium]|nr:hypothetical protein [Bacteroidota bacterium]